MSWTLAQAVRGLLDASGIWAPTAAYTAAEAPMPSAAQQFAALPN